MSSVEAIEAKAHLARLLGRVAKGEKIVITNRGQPVAMLVPPEPARRGHIARIVAEMLKARDESGLTLGKTLTVRQMIAEGRRF